MKEGEMRPESLTYTEIMRQPESWQQTLRAVPAIWDGMRDSVEPASLTHALFIGCGTSLYIAQVAAHSFMELTGIAASAIPASEAFLSPASTVPRTGRVAAFIISRSGTTSEGLLAARALGEHHPHVTTIGVTCNAGTELAARCDLAIELPFASERSVVMTQSFTTMLLALQAVAALVAGDDALLAELATLPAAFADQIEESHALARELAAETFDTTIFLGLGPNQGLAEEGTLKLKEMTQSPCEAYNPLEFRHGPISIVTERTLVVLLEGEREARYLPDLERDLRRYGARVVAVGPHPETGASDALVVGAGLADLSRCALYIPFVQLLACERALALGLDPDRPRNLNQVVVLDAQ
jgi:glucosamine--fructose-6-phosphate aminotransferase (isomerizing)